MPGSYLSVLRRPGAAQFISAGFIGRIPIAMLPLSIVLFVSDRTDSYALAGAMSATFAISMALIGPLGARMIDRYGQGWMVVVLAAIQVLALAGFVVAADSDAHLGVLFGLLVVAGVGPNIGSLVRARWAALLRANPQLMTAFALEAVLDEVVFIVGPVLATMVALNVGGDAAILTGAALISIGAVWLSLLASTRPAAARSQQGSARSGLLSSTMILMVILMILLGGAFGAIEVTAVAFTRDLGQESAVAIILALFAGGSLLAGLVFGRLNWTRPLGVQLRITLTILAVVMIPLPFVTSIPILAAAAVLAGLSISPVLILTVTIVERVVASARLTEAFTLTMSGAAIGVAFGSTASGMIVDRFPPATGFAVMTVSGLAALLAVVLGRSAVRHESLAARPHDADAATPPQT